MTAPPIPIAVIRDGSLSFLVVIGSDQPSLTEPGPVLSLLACRMPDHIRLRGARRSGPEFALDLSAELDLREAEAVQLVQASVGGLRPLYPVVQIAWPRRTLR